MKLKATAASRKAMLGRYGRSNAALITMEEPATFVNHCLCCNVLGKQQRAFFQTCGVAASPPKAARAPAPEEGERQRASFATSFKVPSEEERRSPMKAPLNPLWPGADATWTPTWE